MAVGRHLRWTCWAASAWTCGFGLHSLLTNQRLSYPSPREAFVTLIVLCSATHAASPYLAALAPRRVSPHTSWLAYFAAQAFLVLAISAFARDALLIGALYLPLIAEALLVFRLAARSVLVAVCYLSLFALTVVWLQGISQASSALAALAALLPLLVGLALVLRRQARIEEDARARIQALEARQAEERLLVTERQRMARELHDTLAQGVAGLVLQLEAVDAQLAEQRVERARGIVQQALLHARDTLAGARRAIDDLRAQDIAVEGKGSLGDVIREELARFAALAGIPCSLELQLPAALSPEERECIRRAIAEGLANVARHARATRASVRVAQLGEELEIAVCDDGVGFDPAAARPAGHYGLLGLRERARLAGGRLEVVSAPGYGTRLQVHLPVRADVGALA
jgi:NarL family two-component system sensor histidine kinase YdfH